MIIVFKIYLNFLVCFLHYVDLEEPELIQESEEKDSSIETIEEDSIDFADGEEHSTQTEVEENYQDLNENEEHSEEEKAEEHSEEKEESEEHSEEKEESEEHSEEKEESEEHSEEFEKENYKLKEDMISVNDEILEKLDEVEIPLKIIKMTIPVTIDDNKKVKITFSQFILFDLFFSRRLRKIYLFGFPFIFSFFLNFLEFITSFEKLIFIVAFIKRQLLSF